MKKTAVITATRAEYGLLSKLISKLRDYENKYFHVDLIVTGTHLYKEYGNTIQEIKSNGHRIDYIVKIPVASETAHDISNNQAVALNKFTELFCKEHYDSVIVLGDRYEILSIAIAAGNTKTPLIHLCGGDTTEGAIDEWIRHSITKISYLHFVTNKDSYHRVVQLGENPNSVYNYGSTSIDNINSIVKASKSEALERIGMKNCLYSLCTYHPVTLDDESISNQIYSFLNAMRRFPNIEFIVTKSNADIGGALINKILEKEELHLNNLHVFTSLGSEKYLSLMKYAEFILGNSSSGIIEGPSFHIPTVNIGDRQKGRLQCESIINCNSDTESIVNSINEALSDEMKKKCELLISPYGDGNAADKIANKIYEIVMKSQINLKKSFFDIPLKDGLFI